MAANYQMRWDSTYKRWYKNHHKHRYTISCKQLSELLGRHIPENKEGSYQAANEWWSAKLAEIGGKRPPKLPLVYLDDLSRRRDWASRHGKGELARALNAEIERIREGGEPNYLASLLPGEAPPDFETSDDEPPLEVTLRSYWNFEMGRALDPSDPVWIDRASTEPASADDKRIGVLIESYLERERARVGKGLTSGGYRNTSDRLAHFREWLGEHSPSDSINADRWEGYYLNVLSKGWSREHSRGVFRAARSFVDWLARKGVIERPANLGDRFPFHDNRPDDEEDIEPMPVEVFRALVKHARDTPKELFLLLMANCGFTPRDIGDLKPTEVEWDAGRIIRRRSKTRHFRRPPRVNYLLWPRTRLLLERYGHRDKDLVLYSSEGTILAARWMDESGKPRRKDNVAQSIRRLRDEEGNSILDGHPPKSIRSCSATLIRSQYQYADLRDLFLGHAAASVADRHYAGQPESRLDECIRWLAGQYGQPE